MSYLKTFLLLSLLTGIFLFIGFLWAGTFGMTIFFFIALILNFSAYWYSDKIVLRMYNAKEVKKEENPRLHQLVEKLCKRANLPKPKIYRINLPVPNAFATGRDAKHSAIAVSEPLLRSLNEAELEGVLAHEISHIKNKDMLIATLAATLAGAIGYIAQIAWYSFFFNERRNENLLFLPLIFLAPLAATLIRLAISRNEEFKADRDGALISKKPLALASALEKISKFVKANPIQGNVATSHLFIVNPFKADSFAKLFSTHPPVEERIKRLKALAKELK